MEGLNHSYLVGLAADAGNPDIVIVSASDGPFKSFSPNDAETYMYKKDQGSNKGWKMVSNGLPQPNGTSMSILESNQKVPGEFYAATIMVFLFQLTQVKHGGDLLLNGQRNTYSKLFGR